MDDIDGLLGIDRERDADRLAEELVHADHARVDRLVRLRMQAGLSQAQVAEAMGCSQNVVSEIESLSGDPRISSLRRYALAIHSRAGGSAR